MAEKNVLRVNLDGTVYTLKGEASMERLREISYLVDKKIGGIRALAPSYSPGKVAMLAALQLAEDMLALQDEYMDLIAAAGE